MGCWRRGLTLLTIVWTVVGLSACTTPPPSTAPSPPPSPSEVITAEAVPPISGINQTDRSQLTIGGQLRLGLTDWAEDWNPWTQELPPQLETLLDALRPQFFLVSATGQLTPNLDWLAAPPTVTHDPVTSVTYHLQPTARWADGQPFSVADFAATWEDCMAAGVDVCREQTAFLGVSAVTAGATAQDIVVTYDRVTADWATTFRRGPARAGSLPAAWTDLAAHSEWLAGPYRIRVFNPSGRWLSLEPNPWWPGQPPLLSLVTATVYPGDGLAAVGAAGELDAWPIDFDPGRQIAAGLMRDFQLRRTSSDRWRVLTLNQKGILADRRLRRAILQGLDRTIVGAATLPGLGWAPELLNHLAWQPGQVDYVDLARVTGLGFDPAVAAAGLDQAGWRLDDDGLRRRSGRAFELIFLVDPADQLSESEGLQVAARLSALGLTVQLIRPDSHQAYTEARLAGDFDLATSTWRNQQQPATDLAKGFATGSSHNVSGYSQSAVDWLLARATVTPEPSQRTELVAAASIRLWNDVAALPLYVLPETWAVRSDLANFGPGGLASRRWEDVGFARIR